MTLLRDYHAAIGEIIIKYSGTLERYAGDGVMVVFNDPVPVDNPALRAVHMALETREAMGALTEKWRELGHDVGFGIGIAHGYATLGTIGFEGRFDYAAIGTVSNVASRLCDEAKPGQILISPRVFMAVKDAVTVEPVGEFTLKGIGRPLAAYNVLAATSPNASHQTALDYISVRPTQQDSALYPAISQLERAAGFQREDTAEGRLDKLGALLSKATNDLRETTPLIADLLSIPTGNRYPAVELTPQKRKEKTLTALVTQAEGLSRREPVLMVYEDFHWSDPTTREWLDLLVSCLAGSADGRAQGVARRNMSTRATGAGLWVSFFLTLLADAYGMAGQPRHGLEALAEATELMGTTQERWAEAETHCLRGTLMQSLGDDTASEDCYLQSLEVARRQSAKFWELRVANDLARLWREQGKREQARELLAPRRRLVY